MLSVQLDAAAQEPEPSAADLERARTLFTEGVQLAQEGQHRPAIERFREVLNIRATAAVRYNLAVQLVEIQELSEADELIQEILDDEGTDRALRSSAADLRLQIEEEGGRLRIEVAGADEGVHVVLDGREVRSTSEPLRVRIGDHHVSVERDGQVIEERDVGVPFGEVVHERFIVAPRAEETATAAFAEEPPPGVTPDEPGLGWKLWLIVGAGVVAVTLAVVLIAVVAGGAEELPADFSPPTQTWR